MRILVCGGRDFGDAAQMARTLDAIHQTHAGPITELIHGDARGADRLGGAWAEARGILVSRYPADWARYGRSAGPRRNERMLAQGRPDRVVAFPGGAGTAHMVRIATAAGVPVMVVGYALDGQGLGER